jgi:hypothetical protein
MLPQLAQVLFAEGEAQGPVQRRPGHPAALDSPADLGFRHVEARSVQGRQQVAQTHGSPPETKKAMGNIPMAENTTMML